MQYNSLTAWSVQLDGWTWQICDFTIGPGLPPWPLCPVRPWNQDRQRDRGTSVAGRELWELPYHGNKMENHIIDQLEYCEEPCFLWVLVFHFVRLVPCCPLRRFKCSLLMSQYSTQQLKNVFNKNPNIAICICRNHFTFMNAIYNNWSAVWLPHIGINFLPKEFQGKAFIKSDN